MSSTVETPHSETPWDVMIVEARRFARNNQTEEAVQQAEHALNDLDTALGRAAEGTSEYERLHAARARIERALAQLRQANAQQREATEERAEAHHEHELEQLDAPLDRDT